MKKKITIDTFRIIAALMIVAIHTYPLTTINENIDYIITRVLFRIAVPFFLMVTGYFIIPASLKNKETLKKYTLKIAKIYAISILIFLPLNLYNHYFTNTSWIGILKDIFINGTFYHLWYFPALLLGLWITYFLLKIKNNKIKISSFLLLYSIGLFGDSYYGFIKDISFLEPIYHFIFSLFDYTRNGIFYTPIFLGIGYLISQKEIKIENKHKVLLVLNFILLIVEGTLLYFYEKQKHSSMYISLITLSYLLFLFLIQIKNRTSSKQRNLATWIYILHPFFIVVNRFIAKKIHLESILVKNSMIQYIAVVFSTICFIQIIDYGKQWMKKKHAKEIKPIIDEERNGEQ